jgi:hypothetical protein
MAQSPCSFLPLADSPLLPFLVSFYLLGNPPCCDRIRPPWSQVTRKLTSPSSTRPIPSPLQIPSTQVNYAPHYDDFKNPASLVRNMSICLYFFCSYYIFGKMSEVLLSNRQTGIVDFNCNSGIAKLQCGTWLDCGSCYVRLKWYG